jgi:hypothetical protein
VRGALTSLCDEKAPRVPPATGDPSFNAVADDRPPSEYTACCVGQELRAGPRWPATIACARAVAARATGTAQNGNVWAALGAERPSAPKAQRSLIEVPRSTVARQRSGTVERTGIRSRPHTEAARHATTPLATPAARTTEQTPRARGAVVGGRGRGSSGALEREPASAAPEGL